MLNMCTHLSVLVHLAYIFILPFLLLNISWFSNIMISKNITFGIIQIIKFDASLE